MPKHKPTLVMFRLDGIPFQAVPCRKHQKKFDEGDVVLNCPKCVLQRVGDK